jgi:hypothetical protein
MALIKTLSVAGMVVLAGAAPAAACSCRPPTEASVLASSDVALQGRVTRVSKVGGETGRVFAVIRVEKSLKGRLPRVITVETRASSAACGIAFRPGERVRLGADRKGRNYASGLCSLF